MLCVVWFVVVGSLRLISPALAQALSFPPLSHIGTRDGTGNLSDESRPEPSRYSRFQDTGESCLSLQIMQIATVLPYVVFTHFLGVISQYISAVIPLSSSLFLFHYTC